MVHAGGQAERLEWLKIVLPLLAILGIAQFATSQGARTDGTAAGCGGNVPRCVDISNSGTFIGSEMNEYNQSRINGATPTTEWQATQGSTFATDGLASAVSEPPGATVINANAVAGYVDSSADSSNRTIANAVAGYFSGWAKADNSAVWGLNPIVFDLNSERGASLTGSEIDVKVNGAPSFVRGEAIQPYGQGLMPSGQGFGLEVANGLAGQVQWTSGIRLDTLATATSLNNYSAPSFDIVNSVWNGNAPTGDDLRLSSVLGTGANPFVDYIWSHPGGSNNSISFIIDKTLQFGLANSSGDNSFLLPNSAAENNSDYILPAATDTLVGRASTDTLQNKTLASPVLLGTPTGNNIPILGSLTTTSATSNDVTLIGMTNSGHCLSLVPTNADAAKNIETTYVSAKNINQITVTHAPTSGMTFDVACTPN